MSGVCFSAAPSGLSRSQANAAGAPADDAPVCTVAGCGVRLHPKPKYPRKVEMCRTHALADAVRRRSEAAAARMAAIDSTCATPGCTTKLVVKTWRPGKLCRDCTPRSDAVRAKRREAMAKRFADPAARAAHSETMRTAIARAMTERPDFAAAKRAQGKRLASTGLGVAAIPAGSEARRRAGQKTRAAKLAWCPPPYWPIYRFLLREQHMSRAEAMTATLEQISADERAFDRGSTDQQIFVRVRELRRWRGAQANAACIPASPGGLSRRQADAAGECADAVRPVRELAA